VSKWFLIALSVVAPVLLCTVGGCNLGKGKEPSADVIHKPGDPVPFKTNYFVVKDGQRRYYLTEDDMKLGMTRLQRTPTTQPH